MGCVQQAVLEFDEEVQAPWRPRLAAVPELPAANAVAAMPVRHAVPHPSRRSPSRVGACRPPATGRSGARPSVPASRRLDPGAPAGVRPVRAAAAPARLRLTRRARRLAVVLALAGGVALGSWLAPLVNGVGDGGLRLAGESSVVVQGGDTLWSIASSVAGDADVRAVVDEIQRLNHLDGTVLVPGQVLQLP
jgi:nucleoid-associated protein YgaU